MKTYTAGTGVKGGFYFNTDEWDMLVVPEEGQVLPGRQGNRYVKLPALGLFFAAPLLGAAFAMFLPFIGLALVGKFTIDKTVHAVRLAAAGAARTEARTVLGPQMTEGELGSKTTNHAPTDREC